MAILQLTGNPERGRILMVSKRTQTKDSTNNPEKPLAHLTSRELMSLSYPCSDLDHPGTGNLTIGGHDDSRDHR